MNRPLRLACAVVLSASFPLAALAQPHGGSRGGGRPAGPGPGTVRQPAPVYRAPAPNRAPISRPTPSQGGFNFNRDIIARPPAPVQRRTVIPQRPPQISFRGRVIANPHHWNRPWSWNRSIVWQPAPIYWGGGFWGPWAIAALGAAALFGTIVLNEVTYPSYQVEADSPGALLLQNYGLQQTPCGQPNLVVIWGPNNSVICTYPNNTVGPGNYELDPSTLTITSQ